MSKSWLYFRGAAVYANEYALTHRKMVLSEQVCLNPPQTERVGRENSTLQFSHSFKGGPCSNPSENSAGRPGSYSFDCRL